MSSKANPAHPAALFSLSWSYTSKKLNFKDIFEIFLSSRHQKCCQMLERLFVVFFHSINIPCEGPRRISNELNKVAESMSMPILSDSTEETIKRSKRKVSTASAFFPICKEIDQNDDGEGPIPYIEEKSLNQQLSAIEEKLALLVRSIPKSK